MNFLWSLLIVLAILDVALALLGLRSCRTWLMYVRLLRSCRIFILFDVLSRFVVALSGLRHQLSWIFAVIALVTYVCAIFLAIYTRGEEDRESDVFTSALLLFQVTTMDNWIDPMRPLLANSWAWAIFAVIFIAFTALIMPSLLTAVLAADILKVTAMQDEQEHRQAELKKLAFTQFLRESFTQADVDGNGMLDEQEFLTLIHEEYVSQKMTELGLDIQYEELRETFCMLDVTESGELSIDQFIDGLSQMQQNLGIKQVMSLNYSMQKVYNKLKRDIHMDEKATTEALRLLNSRLQEVERDALLRSELLLRLDILDTQLSALILSCEPPKDELSLSTSSTPRELVRSLSSLFRAEPTSPSSPSSGGSKRLTTVAPDWQ